MSVIGIFGVRGGGTSAIAGVVKLHGYTMSGHPKTLDDTDLYIDMSLATRRQGDWAFKHPFLTPRIRQLKHLIPGLKCIYVFRDPVASAEHGAGNHIDMVTEDHDTQSHMLGDKEGLYISYERAITFPEETVKKIAQFIDRPINPKAIKWLDPKLKYRDVSDYE